MSKIKRLRLGCAGIFLIAIVANLLTVVVAHVKQGRSLPQGLAASDICVIGNYKEIRNG